MATILIPGKTGDVSDGYHTFNELYEHRITIFIALMKSNPKLAWIAPRHSDNSLWEGWFIAGMRLPTGDVTYHINNKYWELAKSTGCEVRDVGYVWDGHTSADVIKRICEWVTYEQP